MSVKAVSWVLDDLQGLKQGPSLVMLALADFADERNSCFPGQDRIAARARCSKRSVISHLKELEELGLISVERRTYSNGTGSIRRTSNRYVLHLDKAYSVEDAKSAPTRKRAGHAERAKSAPTSLEGAKNPASKVQPVALNEPPVIEPPALPPTPQVAEGTAAPSGAEPAGSAGEGSSLQWTDRLAAISLALIGQGRLPEGVTDDELAQVRALQAAASDENADGVGFSVSDEDVITPVESSGNVAAAEADAQLELARQVLPAPMQAMGPTHLAKVGGELAKRLEAGWLPDQITAILASRQLPSQVRNLVALVLARLRDDVPVDQPPPAGTDWSAGPSSQRWSRTLADGRVVTRKDLDCGLLAIDFNHARQSGDWAGDDRMAFAVAVGIERYLTS